ncbi:MAG: type II and III secretion system protein family protein [Rhodospirillales bacterium]|nr:type II and III secretion system protein family protein [Rhodospirillales bacterium]
MISPVRVLLSACLLCAVMFGGAVTVYASKTDLVTIAAEKHKKDPTIVLVQGMAEIVDVPGPVADIMVANPDIVDVMALQSNRLYLVGVNVGSTNLIAVDENGDIVKRLNVHVKIDDEVLQDTIRELFPEEEVYIKTLTDQLILTGTVSTPDVAQRISSLVAHYMGEIQDLDGRSTDEIIVNLLKVRGKSQVMLRVKVLEVSRSLLKERGTDTDIADLGDVFGESIQNNPTEASLSGFFGGVIQTGVTETPFAAFGLLENLGAFGPIDTILTLLEENGMAKILAEPNLTAISGENAGFLAGGEFPVPSGRDSEGNVVIVFRQFGVSLAFTPIVMSPDRISMQLETEVSSLSRESAVTLADIDVPGLDVRRASTTVEMGSGTTLMIAGLLQSQTVNNMSGIPGMMNTPIIGDLMSSESFRRDETEMVVLVTPYLVEPYGDKNQAKKIPAKDNKQDNLEKAFARNIRRTFGNLKVSGIFDGQNGYGYIIE